MTARFARPFVLAAALALLGCSDGAEHETHAGHDMTAEPPAESTPAADAQSVQVGDLHLVFAGATVRLPVAGSGTAAGYVEIRNLAGQGVVLTGAASSVASRVELHTMEMDGDMMRMRQLESVELAPDESVRFERGGRHLMLFDVSDAPDSVEVVFETSDGERLPVQFATTQPTAG